MTKIKLALADDHKEFRNAIKRLIHSENDLEVILEAENGLHLLDKLKTKTPDIILMDIRMPKMNGIEATDRVKDEYPQIKIIAFSQYDREENIFEMYIHGVKSFIGKEDEPEELFKAIRTVNNGGAYMTDKATSIVQGRLSFISRQGVSENECINMNDLGKISSVESVILYHTACHKSVKEIAEELSISPNTVNNHQANLRKKLNLFGRSSLLKYGLAVKSKLIQIVVPSVIRN
jgi:DNA-binding NarL/FixJ family response regulator